MATTAGQSHRPNRAHRYDALAIRWSLLIYLAVLRHLHLSVVLTGRLSAEYRERGNAAVFRPYIRTDCPQRYYLVSLAQRWVP